MGNGIIKRCKQGKNEKKSFFNKRFGKRQKFTRLHSTRSCRDGSRRISCRKTYGYSRMSVASRSSRQNAYLRSDMGYKQLINAHATTTEEKSVVMSAEIIIHNEERVDRDVKLKRNERRSGTESSVQFTKRHKATSGKFEGRFSMDESDTFDYTMEMDSIDTNDKRLWNVASPLKRCVDRVEETSSLHWLLAESSTVVITGSAGVGKTELAVIYCHKQSQFFDAVNWIDASSEYSMQQFLKKLLCHVGLKIDGDVDMECATGCLSKYYSGKTVLFVLDNVKAENLVQDFISLLNSNKESRFKVLITSQISNWKSNLSKYKLKECSKENAIKLITQSIPSDHFDMEGTKEIVEMLKSQLLPIQIAIDCMLQNGLSTSEYNLLLRDKFLDCHNKYANATNFKLLTIVMIILIDQMKDKDDRLLLQLGHVLSFLDGSKIERYMLEHLKFDKAISKSIFDRFEKFAFIKVHTSRNAIVYSMHELVQNCFRKDLLEITNTFIDKHLDHTFYISRISEMIDDVKSASTNKSSDWIHHSVYMFRQYCANGMIMETLNKSVNDAIRAHITKMDYTPAMEILQDKLKHEKSRCNFSSALYTKYLIGYCLRSQGCYDEAIKLFGELYDVRRNEFGTDHFETLSTYGDIGLCLQYKGEYDDAIRIFTEIYETQRLLLGDENNDTLKSCEKIACCLEDKGDLDEAIRTYKQIHETQTKVFGPDHTETLMTYSSVACCMQDKGYYDDALRIFRYIYELQKNRLGRKHPDTLVVRHNEALCLQNKGSFKQALMIYQELYDIQIQLLGLGPKHFDTLITYYNIALCMQGLKCFDEAVEILNDVHKAQQNILGLQYDMKLKTSYYIGICLRASGKYEEALHTYQELYQEQMNVFGREHAETLLTYESIAQCLQDIGDFEAALNIFEEVHEIQRQILGEEHLDTLYTFNNIALCQQDQGDKDEAMRILKFVYEKQKMILGETHLDTLISYHNIALCMQEKGDYNEALGIFRTVYEAQKTILGEDHYETIITFYNIAVCEQGKHNYDEAVDIYRQIHETHMEAWDANQPESFDPYHNMGLCLQGKGCYDEAAEIYLEVYERQKIVLGEQHGDTLVTYCDIALCMQDKGNFYDALRIFEEVYEIQKTLFGENHVDTLRTSHNIDICKERISCSPSQ